ncbi:ACDE family multidrug resistance protein [Salirhabdus euzebyi]|uniref:ACDE family multidrug resistance protein n=1 Tax=Salirhabdus euzebyi TaxID=394506 RepID=A0A841Q911_9BACI|nr:MFS transporter [Salirhabdus euzebyi]MBB6454803.1 ACDE family multidrug resistance protein [Salirhabdus euzebyi]
MHKQRGALFALASIPLLMTLGNSMFIPVLPILEKELDISAFQSSMIITVYSVIAIPLIPIAGYLSDKIGRKKVMIPSLIITGIGGAISAFAAWKLDNPYMIILVGRLLQGIGAAGAFPVVIPTVGDLFKEEEKVSQGLGIIETSNTFGKVLSPILGALLAIIIWFAPFVSVPILSLIAIGLLFFLVKPPKNEEPKHSTFKQFLKTIKKVFKQNGRWLTTTFFIGCLNMFVLFGFLFHLSSILEDEYNMKGVMKGFILAIPLLFLSIASFITGKKVGESKPIMKCLIFIGNVSSAVSLFFIKMDMTLFMMLLLLTFAGIGIGISLPCLDALITEGIKKDIRGSVTSLYSSMRFVGVAAGPPIAAILMKSFPAFLYIGFAGLSLVAAIITFLFIKPDSETQDNILAVNRG